MLDREPVTRDEARRIAVNIAELRAQVPECKSSPSLGASPNKAAILLTCGQGARRMFSVASAVRRLYVSLPSALLLLVGVTGTEVANACPPGPSPAEHIRRRCEKAERGHFVAIPTWIRLLRWN